MRIEPKTVVKQSVYEIKIKEENLYIWTVGQ